MKKSEIPPLKRLNHSYYQQTLKKSFTCVGRGLHTGLQVIMSVVPAEANSGYRFVRRDVDSNRNEVLATWHTVTDTHLSTTVANKMGTRVSTIEHLVAALHACGVDNAHIVLDGPEVPIMDGSSKPFVQLIENAGIAPLKEKRMGIVIRDEVKITDGHKSASLVPSPVPRIEYSISFKSSAIGKQYLSYSLNDCSFQHKIAPARTFGFVEQLTTLQELGFARGGSLQNAILVDGHKIVNENGLRYTDEFVRHKVLDSIGDLALVGAPILGCFVAHCSGHKLNNELLRKLMLNEHAYEYIPLEEADARWLNWHISTVNRERTGNHTNVSRINRAK